jgi:serine/threonine protein kinase/Tfp pilus assembly protein PilF
MRIENQPAYQDMSQQHYRHALEPGYHLHWYTIGKVLGQGGFGITYLAHDTNLDQKVAIKEFLPAALVIRDENNAVQPSTEEHVPQYQWALDRFITEARTLAKFDHNNIVRVLAVFEANNAAYIVMRYEEGQNLEEYLLEHGPLSEQRLLDIILPIIDGLEIVHQAGFIHRDIKPDNIFIRADGSPVLIDFGAAREAMGDDKKTLTTLVSPGYAPIEQYLTINQDQGPWTDIYALGGTLYRATMGKRPVDAITRSNDLLSEKPDPYRSVVGSLGEQYSHHFLQAIDAAMRHKRINRPQDLMAWRSQLLGEAIAPESDLVNSEPPVPKINSEAKTVSYSKTTEEVNSDGDHTFASDHSMPVEVESIRENKPGSLGIVVSILVTIVLVAGIFLIVDKTTQEEGIVEVEQKKGSGNTANEAVSVPSILVLPFRNIGNETEDEYLVDGMTDDIITDMSKLSGILVIAGQTALQFKKTNISPLDAGRELNSDFILDGSVRRSGSNLRVNAQLIDVKTAVPLWAERYDRNLDNIFEVQDEITSKIIMSLSGRLTNQEQALKAEVTRVDFDAYDSFLKGQRYYNLRTKESVAEAIDAYKKAIQIDPSFARAYGAYGVALALQYRMGWTDSPGETLNRALEMAQKAVSIDGSNPQVYWALGYVHMRRLEIDKANAAIGRAIEIAPNYADGYAMLAVINNIQGKPIEAIKNVQKAMQINPYYTFEYPYNLGRAYYVAGNYSEAIPSLLEALDRNGTDYRPRLYLIASYVRLGQMDDAKWELDQILTQNPDISISYITRVHPDNKESLGKLVNDIRQAGLPE